MPLVLARLLLLLVANVPRVVVAVAGVAGGDGGGAGAGVVDVRPFVSGGVVVVVALGWEERRSEMGRRIRGMGVNENCT